MTRLIPLGVLLLGLLFAGGAHAQQEVNLYCNNGTKFVPASPSAPCPIVSPNVTPTDHSGTIQQGALAQQLMAANTARRGCWVQNQSGGDLWVYELSTAAATQPSHWLPSGSEWTCPTNGVPVGAISIFGATSTQAFAAREW